MMTFPLPGANWTYLHSFYVLKPSGDPTGATDAARIMAAVAALPATGGTVYLGPGTWHVECGQVVIARSGVYIEGAGKWATYVYAVGTGAVFWMHDAMSMGSLPYERAVNGGGLRGMAIDGANAGGGSAGFHVGDILQLELDVAVLNFSGAGSIGAYYANLYYWTEQLTGIVFAQNCTQHHVFDCPATAAASSTGSFDRMDFRAYVNQIAASQDGVVFQNGAYLSDGALAMRGNFTGSAAALTSAVLRVTGETPGQVTASSYSNISGASRLDIGVECDGNFTHGPYSIYFGSSSNYISDIYGNLNFSAESTAFTHTNMGSSLTFFYGPVTGDSSLTGMTWYGG